MHWYIEVLKKYADFSGRARRKEYWLFVLINLAVAFTIGIIDGLAGLADPVSGYGPLGGLYVLAVLIPGIAVGVRRLHDTDRSGWWLLMAVVPFAAIALLIFLASDSQAGTNQHGPSPKAVAA